MSLDFVEKFKELSVSSSSAYNFINKHPLNVFSNPDYYYNYENSKYSSRILLNYKDMNKMSLKAGSLVRIHNKGVLISNIFEVWPSIMTNSNELTFGTLNVFKWLSINNGDKVNIVSLNFEESPILIAKNIEFAFEDLNHVKYSDHVVEWLKNVVFAGKFSCFVLFDGIEVHFSILVKDYVENQSYRYDCSETVLRQKNYEFKISRSTSFSGLEIQFDEIIKLIDLFFNSGTSKGLIQINTPHGVLLYGPPGCGKTMLVKSISEFLNVPVLNLIASDLTSNGYGEAEMKMKNIFQEAKNLDQCIIFMDEIDSLCPKRDSFSSSSSQRNTTLLLTLMDGCIDEPLNSKIFFIGATNMPSALDSALRRPGRFDREIEISPPSNKNRFKILKSIIHKYPCNLNDSDLNIFAEMTHGYVGSDLSLLCKEAYIHSIKNLLETKDTASISLIDLQSAFSKIRPSAMREVFVEVPMVKWADIGGQNVTKQKLIECVEWPIKFPARFSNLGINPPKGILLFGPPGCSKTLLAKALASESGLNFLAVKGPEIFSKYVGESEKKIREIFRRARQASPSIIFFDEFDSISGRSEQDSSSSISNRVMSQLLSEMDGLEPLVNVIIVAATNKPDLIDKALLRPGRFDRHIYISLPDYEGRFEIFKILMQKMPFSESFSPEIMAHLTNGFSGAEITSLCQNSAIRSLERDISCSKIEWNDFEFCLSRFERQIDLESLKIYEKFIE